MFDIKRVDLVFVTVLCAFCTPLLGQVMLGDADIGWHIRNGEHIIATQRVPTTNYFSSYMYNADWFAWEWLYDLVAGFLHLHLQLAGVVIFTALLYAMLHGYLFQQLIKRSGNVVVAGILMLVSLFLCRVHLLTRPHVVTWVLLVWLYVVLENMRKNNFSIKNLLQILLITIVWVNTHASFFLIFLLINIYMLGCLYDNDQHITKRFLWLNIACLLCSFINPYGLFLHLHVIGFLKSYSMLDMIGEYATLNIHSLAGLLFVALLITAALILALSKPSAIDILLAIYAAVAGLHGVRHMPLSVLLLTLLLAPHASSLLAQSKKFRKLYAYGQYATQHEMQLKNYHLLSLCAVISVLVLAKQHKLTYQFDAKKFPVAATQYLAAQHIKDGVYTHDAWGSYLTYALHPNFMTFIDDRFDLYGAKGMKAHQRLANAEGNWRDVLKTYHINRMLVPSDLGLVTVLRETTDWHLEYSDTTASLFVYQPTTSY